MRNRESQDSNLGSQISDLKSQISDSESETSGLKSETSNPPSEPVDRQPSILDPESEIRSPQSSIVNRQPSIPTPHSALRTPQSSIVNRQSSIGWLWVVGWVWAAGVVFSLGFAPLRVSHDEWWHLKTGKWIVEHHWRLPQKDIFTYTAESYDWDNHEWLTQAVMFLVYRWGDERAIGGWRAVILAKTCILIATYLLLGLFMFRRAGGGARGHAVAIFLMVVAAAVGRRTFWPRPPVVSYFFMVFFLYVLWQHRTGRLRTPWLFVLPAIMPLWANLHGGFILGEVVIAMYAAGEVAEWAIGRWIARRSPRDLRPVALRVGIYAATGVLCAGMSLLTPFGYRLYLLSGRVMSSKDLVLRLNELMPPDLRYTWGYIFLAALILAGLCVSLIAARRGAKESWPPMADLLLVAFFFWQSINHVRHLPLFGLSAAPTAAWMLARFWGRDPRLPAFPPLRTALVGLAFACGAWLVFFPSEFLSVVYYLGRSEEEKEQYALMSNYDRNVELFGGMEAELGTYPAGAVEFVLAARLPGRMFNVDNMGGYLIWRLSPEHYKVFTDQRFDIFGDDFLMQEIGVARGAPPGAVIRPYNTPLPYWRDVIEKWHINWILIDLKGEINEILIQPDSGWALVYADNGYFVWLKRAPGNQPWIAKYEDKPRSREWLEFLDRHARERLSPERKNR